MLGKIKEDIGLIERHIGVLAVVVESGPIGIIKLAELLKLPQHRIRYSLRVLEMNGYIRASSSGAVATEQAKVLFSHLDTDIDEIIAILVRMKETSSELQDERSDTNIYQREQH